MLAVAHPRASTTSYLFSHNSIEFFLWALNRAWAPSSRQWPTPRSPSGMKRTTPLSYTPRSTRHRRTHSRGRKSPPPRSSLRSRRRGRMRPSPPPRSSLRSRRSVHQGHRALGRRRRACRLPPRRGSRRLCLSGAYPRRPPLPPPRCTPPPPPPSRRPPLRLARDRHPRQTLSLIHISEPTRPY